MLEAGAPLPYVMDQVGHADSKTTLEIYAQVQKRVSRKNVDAAFDAEARGVRAAVTLKETRGPMRNSPGHTDILARQHRVAILTPAERERALTRAAEVGAAQAGRELGIAPGTIRVWRSRAAVRAENGGRVDMPGDVSGVDPADTWTAAQEALAQFRELMASGKTLETQRAAISMGVLIDKSRILEERAAMAHERAVVLAADQAKMVVRMIRIGESEQPLR